MFKLKCSSCGYGGKPKEDDGYLYCAHCGTGLGPKPPSIIWGFMLALAALFFSQKKDKTDKKPRRPVRRKKKGVSFKRAFFSMEIPFALFLVAVYFLNRPYSQDVGVLLTTLEALFAGGTALIAFISVAVKDITTPWYDEYEDD